MKNKERPIKLDIILKSGLIGSALGLFLFIIWMISGSKEIFLLISSLISLTYIFYNSFLDITADYLTLDASLNLFLAISLILEGFILGCIAGIIIKYTGKKR